MYNIDLSSVVLVIHAGERQMFVSNCLTRVIFQLNGNLDTLFMGCLCDMILYSKSGAQGYWDWIRLISESVNKYQCMDIMCFVTV